MGFSGFRPWSPWLKEHNFIGIGSGLFGHSNFSRKAVFWAAQCRLVQQLDSLQFNHFLTWVWSFFSIETSPGAPSYYPLYFAFRKVIKWLSSSLFATFPSVFNVYFVFIFCCIDYLLYITCIPIRIITVIPEPSSWLRCGDSLLLEKGTNRTSSTEGRGTEAEKES